ncbi:MAG: ArsA-related P-loop ATPase [Polyangiaceae bacterium]
MTARLHVLLGAGGVGKTTLAAGYALSLARSGSRVGLLGIDPARRLQGALGVILRDEPLPVTGWEEPAAPPRGALNAALLRPEDCLRRWAEESASDPAALAELSRNTFFLALADRLAAAADVLAAIRVAEWAERDPAMTDLVVDTAPGLNAIDFLRRPRALTVFLEGRLIRWLRAVAPSRSGGALSDVLRGGARRAVGGLSRLGGTRLILELGDFVSLVEGMLERMLSRLEKAQGWLQDPATEILLVTAVRDDAADAAHKIARALRAAGLAPTSAVLNRALPASLAAELARLTRSDPSENQAPIDPPWPREAHVIATYARLYIEMQERVAAAVAPLSPRLVIVPAARGLDEDARASALTALGDRLRNGLLAADR